MERPAVAPAAAVEARAAALADAARPARCNLAPDVGRCRSRRPRFHYDAQRRHCRLFFWGGCEGNDNRQVAKYKSFIEG